jgi:phosphatidylserine/phosphatidylglycerophosphate/cardiolipin synthase-like enzyme
MHGKVTWNDRGEVLFGSANLDAHSMKINFESCVKIKDPILVSRLSKSFNTDLESCEVQTPQTYPCRSLAGKLFTHACNLTASWL